MTFHQNIGIFAHQIFLRGVKIQELYPYQQEAVDTIINELNRYDQNVNVLFQLPTGGGKTVIFSQIARHCVEHKKKKVLILTHRIELCRQTATVLDSVGVKNKIINAEIKELEDQDEFMCFTAMVETLNNRLSEDPDFIENIGLVIVDEAHYNSFRKIFQYFDDVNILGVTATPLSSNRNLPLKDNYNHLVVGNSIRGLIGKGYLSKATTFTYDVNLKGLKIGVHGDYTVSSIEQVYSSGVVQQRLLTAYQEVAEGQKTLIFNAGILSSRAVEQLFLKAGYPVKHLDSTFSKEERKSTLDWFRETPNAILSSVGILTTGFDEPSVQTILLNRATRSLTLYHQMIGRGSRILNDKKTFNIIDLGNNAKRLGYWDDEINWHEVFLDPDKFLDKQLQIEKGIMELDYQYEMPPEIKEKFPVSKIDEFDIKQVFKKHLENGMSTKKVIDLSIDDHLELVTSNATDDIDDAMMLARYLEGEIEHRMHQYKKCVNGTDNYAQWLVETYVRKLNRKIQDEYALINE